MEKKLIARNIAGMVEQMDEGPVRAVYMVVKELYELCCNYNYTSNFEGNQQTNAEKRKKSKSNPGG